MLVGDTPLDVAAAREGGARAVAVATGPFGEEELGAAGADAVLAGPEGHRGRGRGRPRELTAGSAPGPEDRTERLVV